MYPSLTDYISSIELAQDTLATLNYLRPVRKPNGQPFFSSGNFAVVFKMEDTRTGEHMALKCFLRDVPDRARRLRLIAEYIQDNPSPYLVSMTYLTDELWVDCRHCDRQEFDVVLMPWVEGMTLGEYVGDLCIADDWRRNSIVGLAKRFDSLLGWLTEQPFAHGDLKPDNILVDGFGNLKMIDYDGCFIPALAGEDAIELGTLPYRHPERLTTHYGKYIDGVALISLSLELHALVIKPELKKDLETLILNQEAFQDKASIQALWSISQEVAIRIGLLISALKSEVDSIHNLPTSSMLLSFPRLYTINNHVEYNGEWSLRYGYWLTETYTPVIPYIYDNAKGFSEGLAAVELNNKWGYIDLTGKVLIEPIYDSAESFSNGLAPVWKNNKCGFINLSGQVTIPLIYGQIEGFLGGLGAVRQGNRKQFYLRENWGLINKIGQLITPLVYDHVEVLPQELAIVAMNGKYGLVNKTGKIIVPVLYNRIERFRDSLAAIQQDEKWGFINEAGEIIIPILYKGPLGYVNFEKGLAVVKQNDKWGVINTKGQIIIEFIYDNIRGFEDGMILVKHNNKCGFLNEKGHVAIPLIYDDARSFRYGLAKVNQGYYWGLINKLNQTIAPLVYDDITDIICFENSENINGLMKVEVNGLFGLIDKNGNLVTDVMFSHIHSFDKGFAKVQNSDDFYGILNQDFELIIPMEYNEVRSFSQGLLAVKRGRKWGYLNERAQTVISFKYDYAFSFEDGWAAISVNQKRGFVDCQGVEDWTETWNFRETSYYEWESENYY